MGVAGAEYWRRAGLGRLRDKMREQPIRTRAKNVILFLGDGMSIPTLTAARIQSGGESSALAFERFPYSGLSKVRQRDFVTVIGVGLKLYR